MPMLRSVSWNGMHAPEEHDRLAERDDGERQEARHHREDRRQVVDAEIGVRGRDALLEEELEAVGERDQDAARAGAHGSHARLHVRDHLPLHPDVEHHGDQQREEDHDHAHDEEPPVHPVHQADTSSSTGASTSEATASSVTSAVKEPESNALAANPAWLNGTNTDPRATSSVTRAGSSASPGRRAHQGPGPVDDPQPVGVRGMDLHERLLGERRLQLVGTIGEPALIDEQRVREETEAVGGPNGLGGAHRQRDLARRQQAGHLLVQFIEGLEPEVAPARERHAREDLPVGQRDALGPADRVHQLAASLPRGHVTRLLQEGRGGQERVDEGLERSELQPLHDLVGHVLERAQGEVRVGGIPQRIHADEQQDVDLAVGAGLEDGVGVPAGRTVHHRPPHGLHLVEPVLGRAPPGQQAWVHAGAQGAPIVRPSRDVGEAGARLERQGHRRLGAARSARPGARPRSRRPPRPPP